MSRDKSIRSISSRLKQEKTRREKGRRGEKGEDQARKGGTWYAGPSRSPLRAECELAIGHQPVYPGETSVQYLCANKKSQGREEECTNLVEVDAGQGLLVSGSSSYHAVEKVASVLLVKPPPVSRATIRAFLWRMLERSRRRRRRRHCLRRHPANAGF